MKMQMIYTKVATPATSATQATQATATATSATSQHHITLQPYYSEQWAKTIHHDCIHACMHACIQRSHCSAEAPSSKR